MILSLLNPPKLIVTHIGGLEERYALTNGISGTSNLALRLLPGRRGSCPLHAELIRTGLAAAGLANCVVIVRS